MAKFTEWVTLPIYTYAEKLKQALISGDSLLWPENHVWSQENVESFLEAFGNPNSSDDNFITKLREQLSGKPRGVVQLVCDLLFVYLLFPRKIKLTTKVATLRNVSGFYEGLQIEDDNPALQALENGIGSTGTAYNTRRYYELRYILDFALRILKLPSDERESLLADHRKVRAVFDQVKGKANPMSRHILLHLLFPDYYERISSQDHKQKIKSSFEMIIDGAKRPDDTDDAIFLIRRELCALLDDSSIDFYHSPLRECWDSEDAVLKAVALKKV
jgi:5-methylcytosine-specific restriction protein B